MRSAPIAESLTHIQLYESISIELHIILNMNFFPHFLSCLGCPKEGGVIVLSSTVLLTLSFGEGFIIPFEIF